MAELVSLLRRALEDWDVVAAEAEITKPEHRFEAITYSKNGLINLLQAMIMLDFKSYIKNLERKYLIIERHMLQIQGILLQYLKLN